MQGFGRPGGAAARRLAALLSAAAALACGSQALAQASPGRWAVGAQVGTTGPGVEAQLRLSDALVVRGAVEGFRIDHDVHAGSVDYDGRARWLTDSGMLDLHPGGSPFLLTLGAYYGKRDVRVRATPGATAPELAGAEIRGRAKFQRVAPFVGVGWDNTFQTSGHWGFKARAGAIVSKTPSVRLTSNVGQGDPTAQAYLREQEREIAHDLRPARVWPVVQAGVNYRF